jgi:hypothetical protein
LGVDAVKRATVVGVLLVASCGQEYCEWVYSVLVPVDEALESEVAASARDWIAAMHSDDLQLRGSTERRLAESIEIWVAALLSTDERWTLPGRWFDGLAFQECCAPRDDQIEVHGFIVRIDTQRVDPIWIRLWLSPEGLHAFDVRFGDEQSVDGIPYELSRKLVGAHPLWRFRFVGALR